jgi:glycosyltransferase involved in cell wall biosynthesis
VNELRVLHVIDGLGTGGAERSTVELVRRLPDHGIEAAICVTRRRESGVAAEYAGEFELFELDGSRMARQVVQLRRLLRSERFDIVHSSLFHATMTTRLAALGSGSRVVTSLVNTSYDPIRRQDPNLRFGALRAVQVADRATTRLTSHFHAITQAVKRSAIDTLGIAPDRITVIPRGRDGARLGRRSPERATAVRERLGIGAGPVVLSAGRQEFAKGHRHLLAAAPSVLAAHPATTFLVAGREGAATPDLRRQLASTDLGDRFRFLGYRDDLPDLLAAADVFAFPSMYEGQGGVLAEALALEVPIVAFDIPAVREVLADGEAGELVARQDDIALANALNGLLGDAGRRSALAGIGRERFEREYTLATSIERMAALYRTVGVVPGAAP